MIEKENEKLKTANLKMKETTNALNLAEKKAAWASSELEKVSAEMREKVRKQLSEETKIEHGHRRRSCKSCSRIFSHLLTSETP